MAVKPGIASAVAKQLPEFIREDYDTFVAFLEAYYEWLDENYTQRNLHELRDIDKTLDSYLQYIKNELNVIIDTKFDNYLTLNEKEYLKYTKYLYSSKGSEAAYKLLFRVLYGKEIDIFYPSQQMLRVSDGKWQQDISLFVKLSTGDIDNIVGKEITFTNTDDTTVKAFVDRATLANATDSIYEVFVERFFGEIEVDATISETGFTGLVTGTTVSLTIQDGGEGFSVGQIFTIDSAEGAGTKIKISKVSSTGAIEQAQIVVFGTGYETDFNQNISPSAAEVTATDSISIDLNSVNQFSIPSGTATEGFSEIGYITKPTYWASDYCDPSYCGDYIRTFTSETSATIDTTKVAVLKFTINSTAKYPGYYSKNDGFVSDSIFIQDSYFYQAYSYQIKLDELLESYKDTVKAYIHPAGTMLFADYQINKNIDVGAEVGAQELQIRLYFSDNISISESLVLNTTAGLTDTPVLSEELALSVAKPLTDSATITEDSDLTIGLNKTESVTVTEDTVFDGTFGLSDTASITDAFDEFDFGKLLEDTTTITDSGVENTINSVASESISLSESGSILKNSYTFGDYWDPTYAENDSAASTF